MKRSHRLGMLALALALTSAGVSQPLSAQGTDTAGTTTTRNDDRDDGGFDMGWLGLLGLAGLAGLRRRPERTTYTTADTTRRP